MRIRRRVLVVVVSAGLIAAGLIPALGNSAGAAPFNVKQLNKIQRRLISGELLTEMGGSQVTPNVIPGGGDEDEGPGADGAPNTPPESIGPAIGSNGLPANYAPTGAGACSQRLGSNVKVNQNCLNITDSDLQGRGQANNETFDLARPVQQQPPRGVGQRLRARGRDLWRCVLPGPWEDVEQLDHPEYLHPRTGNHPAPVLAGGR